MSLNPSSIWTKRRKASYGVAACVLALVGFCVMRAAGWFADSTPSPGIVDVSDGATIAATGHQTEPSRSVEPTPAAGQMSVELFTISSRGFEPTHITRPAGRVLLVIVTEGELPTLNLRLQRADGAVVGQVNMPSKRKRGSIPATLVPGRYRLVDPNRPRIVCDIEITP